VDELGRAGEARALAELVTARSARPPLAVGLFGDWGEGKSHFLELLHQQVTAVARPGNVLAHQAVRQVRFNAWHYAESGLWASLVAELFAQLAAPPDDAVDPDPGTAQRSMSRLTAELVAQRRLAQRLSAARERRDALHRALRGRELFGGLPAGQRRQLTDLVGGDSAAARLYRQATGDAAVLRQLLLAVREAVRSLGPARITAYLTACAAAVAAVVAAVWTRGWTSGFFGAMPVLGAVLVIFPRVLETRQKLAGPWQAARRFARAQRARVETAAEVAQAEVQRLEREMQNLTAAGQLAGLIGERAAAGDYRSQLGVMTQIREDFQRMAALLARATGPEDPRVPGGPEQDRGQDSRDSRDEAGDELPGIDRIILYVDDLDRCPPARVVEMLEAVHLLLAVPLFVVVVAIDPRWLLRSVALHYRDILDVADLPEYTDHSDHSDHSDHFGGPGGGRQAGQELSTPAQYLEKIFQVVFTLPALDTPGYRQMLRSLVGARDDRDDEQPAAGPGPDTASTAASGAGGRGPAGAPLPDRGNDDGSDEERDEERDEDGVPRVDAVRVVERTDPLTLDRDELALLDLLGPPGLVATPRGVKRLANSYGLLTALRRAHREDDLREVPAATAPDGGVVPAYRPYRAGMVLLAALVGHPALGPALCLHLHRQATEHPDHTWTGFCDTLEPERVTGSGAGIWHNGADSRIPPAQVTQWQTLHAALHRVTRTAAQAQPALHLPARLDAWRQWVLPAARLSFPAGRVVTALHQHQHDDTPGR
jgi:hypothetical protein